MDYGCKHFYHTLPPTSGNRVFAADFFSNLGSISNAKELIEEHCRKIIQVPYVHIASSGTAAFFLILNTLSKITTARTVILPAYTCPLMVFAVVRSGFKVQICDTNSFDYNYDLNSLEKICNSSTPIAAILVTHFGGIPAHIEAIKGIINSLSQPVFLIEDAAQAFGGIVQQKPVGSSGDFAFFSFGLGKGATFSGGGLAVTKHQEYQSILNETIRDYERNAPGKEMYKIIEFLSYYIFYRPSLLYWVYTLPQSFWLNRNNIIRALSEEFSLSFPVFKMSNFRLQMGYGNFLRANQEIENQRQKAFYYMQQLSNIPQIKLIEENTKNGDKATYPFLSLVLERNRDQLFNDSKLRALGITRLYAYPLPEYPYLKTYFKNEKRENYKNATYLCDHLITLSTTSFINNSEMNFLINKIKMAL